MVKMEQHTKALGATDEPALAFSADNFSAQKPEQTEYNGQKRRNTMARKDGIQWPEQTKYNGQNGRNTMAGKNNSFP
jgi:hypothetical protein